MCEAVQRNASNTPGNVLAHQAHVGSPTKTASLQASPRAAAACLQEGHSASALSVQLSKAPGSDAFDRIAAAPAGRVLHLVRGAL